MLDKSVAISSFKVFEKRFFSDRVQSIKCRVQNVSIIEFIRLLIIVLGNFPFFIGNNLTLLNVIYNGIYNAQLTTIASNNDFKT